MHVDETAVNLLYQSVCIILLNLISLLDYPADFHHIQSWTVSIEKQTFQYLCVFHDGNFTTSTLYLLDLCFSTGDSNAISLQHPKRHVLTGNGDMCNVQPW